MNFYRFWLLGIKHYMYCMNFQNVVYTLFGAIGEIKGPLLYRFRFEIILYARLFSQTCRQSERTSLRDGLRLPSNNTLEMIRRQLP